MYPTNPMLQQSIMQLDQEYAQKKANLMQNFYNQQQNPSMVNQNMQNAAQTTQPPAQNVNWIYVSGIDGAKSQIVQPGQTAWMMDNNEPYFYVKSVDGVGSSTFRIFQFAEVQDIAPEQAAQPQIDLSQYVQRDEFDNLKAQLEQLTNPQPKRPQKGNKEVVNNG